jgi:xanthine dehydrogenase YagS FAD-binding subunit
MIPFQFERATDPASAVALYGRAAGSRYLGGGTNLVDLMRENLERPPTLVDVSRLSAEIRALPQGGVWIGAAATNTAVAADRTVREQFPVLAAAILSGASGQIRNMATVGGNILQRTRCSYFYDRASRCNKRELGAGCDAVGGCNRLHAILGSSPDCIATHPSDMSVALAALDATVYLTGPLGARALQFTELHTLPGSTPQIETTLHPGELVTAVELAPLPFARRSLYRKVRDRSSYAFALVSIAAAVDLSDDGKTISEARLALGGVAHKPWRARGAEETLRGATVGEEAFRRAATLELSQAVGREHNAFKIELAQRLIVSALLQLSSAPPT